MTTLKISAALCLTLAMSGCMLGPDYSIATSPITRPAKSGTDLSAPRGNPFLLEVEDFKITDADVVAVSDASGGKAVLLNKTTSKVTSTVSLKKGSYEVTLYIKASDPDHDAVVLNLNGEDHRVFTNDYDHVVPVDESAALEMTADGLCTITITPGDPDVNCDRVEFKLKTP